MSKGETGSGLPLFVDTQAYGMFGHLTLRNLIELVGFIVFPCLCLDPLIVAKGVRGGRDAERQDLDRCPQIGLLRLQKEVVAGQKAA